MEVGRTSQSQFQVGIAIWRMMSAIAASGEDGLEKTFVVKFGARFLGTAAVDFQNQ